MRPDPPTVDDHQAHGPAPRAPLRVVLAERHPRLRALLTTLLQQQPDVLVIATTDNLNHTTHLVNSQQPDVLILDQALTRGTAWQPTHALLHPTTPTRTVISAMDDSRLLAQHLLNAGATGYILKDTADTELPPALHHATHAHPYISPRVR